MWHKYPQPMRNVVRGALIEAARDGKAGATPRDFIRAFAFEPSCSAAQILNRLNAIDPVDAPIVEPVNAISPESMKVIEQAYEESALLKDRLVGTDHLLLALLKLNEAPELQAKGVSYDCAMRELKRLRSWGLGPDFPPPAGRVGPHVALAKRVKKAVGNAVKAYKVYGQLSAMHPKLVTDPYPMYRRLRAKGIVRRDRKSRRSCATLVSAASRAPTARNREPWRSLSSLPDRCERTCASSPTC
jgi:hypothetical protein